MLWLAIKLPFFPLEVFTREQAHTNKQAYAVVEQQRILLANQAALASGIKPHISLNTALALKPALKFHTRETATEQQQLTNLAHWAYQFTPAVSTAYGNTLLLEISGSLTLFKGLGKLLAQIGHGLDTRGYTYAMGLAHTPKAAQVLTAAQALTHDSGSAPSAEQSIQALRQLPLGTLAIAAQHLEKLQKMGLTCIGELLDLPTAALGKRFGEDLQHYLAQLTGHSTDPQLYISPPEHFASQLFFLEPVENSQALVFPMQRLLDELIAFLNIRQLHCNCFTWILKHGNKKQTQLLIELSQAQANRGNFFNLSRIKLENLQLNQGVHTLCLCANKLLPAHIHNHDLFENSNSEPISTVIDKLRNRLGPRSLQNISCDNEHLPERKHRSKSLLVVTDFNQSVSNSHEPDSNALYPTWLLHRPERIQQRGNSLYWHGDLQLLQGPERMESSWWEKNGHRRDYFIAQRADGSMYWIYQDLQSQAWYVQGMF